MMVIFYLLFCFFIFREFDLYVFFIDLFFLVISIVSVIGFIIVDINLVFNDCGIVLLEVFF